MATGVARKSEELRGESARLLQEARRVKDAADGEGRKLTGEERQKIDGLLDDSKSKLDEAKTEERMAGMESAINPEERGQRLPVVVDDPEATEEERRATGMADRPEYRKAFDRYCRMGQEGMAWEDRQRLSEVRALTEGTDPDGGYLAPPQLIAGVQRELQDLEQLAPRMNTINTVARSIQQVQGVDTVTFSWVNELQRKPEDQVTFKRAQINANTAAVIVRVSDELLEDTTFDLENYLAVLAAEAKVEGEEIAFVAGSGNGQPRGILTALNGEAPVGGAPPNRYTTTGIGTLTADDYVRVSHAPKARYRRQSAFVLGTQAVLAARLLKAGDNYIWQPGLKQGQPDSLVGKPVFESEADALDNPIVGGQDVGFFGDLRRYTVLRRLQMQVKRLEELYSETDEVGYRFRFRTGGDVQNTAAFRTIRVRAA